MITTAAVSSTPVQVLPTPASAAYQFIGLCNNGASTAYLKLTPDSDAVTPSNGIALPAGASILVDQDASPILQNGISAVCAEGQSTTIAVQAY